MNASYTCCVMSLSLKTACNTLTEMVGCFIYLLAGKYTNLMAHPSPCFDENDKAVTPGK